MTRFFKVIPLHIKLMLIGFIPFIFLIYFSVQVYKERVQKLDLLNAYQARVKESGDINTLIDELQKERKYSFDFAMKKDLYKELVMQRPRTDSAINSLKKANSPALHEFPQYTFLKDLPGVRSAIDSSKMEPGHVMHYYTTMIFRINTLNAVSPASDTYLHPVYKDLISQKLLSEMITNLGIMRSNIYNVLYSKKYLYETLLGMIGVHQVYETYETEFLLKASPAAAGSYKNLRTNSALKSTVDYIDTLYKRFIFDITYDADGWWKVSDQGINELRSLQGQLRENASRTITEIYEKEITKKNYTLIFLILSIAFVTVIIIYTIRIISQQLNEITAAAKKISLGETGIEFKTASADAIGSLAKSISAIDETNKELAEAAHAIGKGDFDVPVKPRSSQDVLGNALAQMKDDLQKRNEELATSNEELEKFAYVASHDLQEPLRMVRSFLDLLEKRLAGKLDESSQQYIHFATDGAERMKMLIRDLLQYSRVGTEKEKFSEVDCDEIIESVKTTFRFTLEKKNASLIIHRLPAIYGVKSHIEQLFQNLISNALTYQDARDPQIEVGCTEKKDYWEFYVKDNGIGIDPKFLNKIFVVFQRLHGRNEYAGTGIGLAICKKIVEKHGGRIWVNSEPGQGSTFFFTIAKKK